MINFIKLTTDAMPPMPWDIEALCVEGLEALGYPNYNFLFKRFRNYLWREDSKMLLAECPVFIVDSSQMGKLVELPDCDSAVRVPTPEEYDDYLGLYQYLEGNPMPHRIFAFVDRIKQCDENEANSALLLQVICHEISHYLMNPRTYTAPLSSSYPKADANCRYIEEAYANALGLTFCYEALNEDQKLFIEDFVKNQPAGYNAGWEAYQSDFLDESISNWITAKVLFNPDILCDVQAMVNSGHGEYFRSPALVNKNLYCANSDGFIPPFHIYVDLLRPEVYTFSDDGLKFGLMNAAGEILLSPDFEDIETAGRIGDVLYYALKQNGKWAVATLDSTTTKFLYDSIWSFDTASGLCQVAVDKDGKRCYGYVNAEGREVVTAIWHHLYHFENGLTPAKLGNTYYIINNVGETLVDGLHYEDIRAFRKGFALARRDGKWGRINYSGEEAVPCEYEQLSEVPEL